MPRRYCCVFGCHNNDSIVKDWEAETCKIHNVTNGTQQCDCPLPFFLLTLPTKDAKFREEWIRRINWKNWKPSYDSRIFFCSLCVKAKKEKAIGAVHCVLNYVLMLKFTMYK